MTRSVPILCILSILFVTGCAPTPEPSLPDAVAKIARATAAAQLTQAIVSTQDSLKFQQTQAAMQVTATASELRLRLTSSAATQSALITQQVSTQRAIETADTRTQSAINTAVAGTPTAQAIATQTENEKVERTTSQDRWATFWNSVMGILLFGLGVAVIIGLGVFWNWDTDQRTKREVEIKRIEAERDLLIERERAEIQAKLERERMELERLKLYFTGRMLFQLSQEGWKQVTEPNRELLPSANTEPDDERELPEQRHLREFIIACMDVPSVGPHGRFIPSAAKLKMHPQVRSEALAPLRGWVEATVGAHGGTAIRGGKTLHDLLEMNRRGDFLVLTPTPPPNSQ